MFVDFTLSESQSLLGLESPSGGGLPADVLVQAVFVSCPVPSARVVIVSIGVSALTASGPGYSQVTMFPEWLQVQPLPEAETNTSSGSSVSVTLIGPEACLGPLFPTRIVDVMSEPWAIVPLVLLLFKYKSAPSGISV